MAESHGNGIQSIPCLKTIYEKKIPACKDHFSETDPPNKDNLLAKTNIHSLMGGLYR